MSTSAPHAEAVLGSAAKVAVLRALLETTGPTSLGDVARTADLPKSSAKAAIDVLVDAGVVVRARAGNRLALSLEPRCRAFALAVMDLDRSEPAAGAGATWISAPVDAAGARALRQLERGGLATSEAVSRALVAEARRQDRRRGVAAEVARLAADPADRAATRELADFMDEIRVPW